VNIQELIKDEIANVSAPGSYPNSLK